MLLFVSLISILQEYIEVLSRPKFARFADFITSADYLIAQLSDLAKFYKPNIVLRIIKDDADNKFFGIS